MKLISPIFFILITNIGASFSSEFRNAVHTVENSFGKLFTDVVTDVRDTISCAVLAVEHAFALNRFDTSEHYKKCNGEYGPKAVANKVQQQQVNPVFSNFKMLGRSSNKDIFHQQIPVMSTLNEYLDKFDKHNNVESVNSEHGELNRLAEVSAILRKGLDKMSNNVRMKFDTIELNGKRPSLGGVWNQIKLLYDLEEEQKNGPDATEIRRTIDDVLTVLDIHENSNTPEKDKIKDIMNNLENDPNNNINNIDNNLPAFYAEPIEKQNNQTKKARQLDDFPSTFREVAKKIIEDKPIQNVNTSNNESTTNDEALNKTQKLSVLTTQKPLTTTIDPVFNIEKEDKPIKNVNTSNHASTTNDEALNKTEKLPVLTTQKLLTTTINPVSNIEKGDYDSFFQSSDDNEAMQAADQANKIIEDSKQSQIIMDSIFGDSNGNLDSVF